MPFIVASGGDFVIDQFVPASGAVNEGDDTAANPEQPEAVDIAPTVAWMLGLDPALVMPAAQGRVLDAAFSERPIDAVEPHANRAIVLIFDGNNSVRIHDLDRRLRRRDVRDPENLADRGGPLAPAARHRRAQRCAGRHARVVRQHQRVSRR